MILSYWNALTFRKLAVKLWEGDNLKPPTRISWNKGKEVTFKPPFLKIPVKIWIFPSRGVKLFFLKQDHLVIDIPGSGSIHVIMLISLKNELLFSRYHWIPFSGLQVTLTLWLKIPLAQLLHSMRRSDLHPRFQRTAGHQLPHSWSRKFQTPNHHFQGSALRFREFFREFAKNLC